MAFEAGEEISIAAWPESVSVTEETNFLEISSTTFIPGSPACEALFLSPSSGRVGVVVSGSLQEQANNTRVFLSFEVYEGTSASGTLVWDAEATYGVSTSGFTGGAMTLGNFTIVRPLTPGVAHYVRTMHMVEAGATSDLFSRRLVVIPLP